MSTRMLADVMRVLVATTAGSGHFGPLIPFAAALREAGHHVAVAAPASFTAAVDRAGFKHIPFADAPAAQLAEVFATLPEMSVDEANATVVREVFGRLDTASALPGMRLIVSSWNPDVVLRETSELSSYVVAHSEGLPHVEVAAGLSSFTARFLPQLDKPLAELGVEDGVDGLRMAPVFTTAPSSLEVGPSSRQSVTRFREEPLREQEPLPAWWSNTSDPLVYVTFGSVAAGMGLFPHLYQAVIDVLAEAPMRVLVTTGDAGDPGELGVLPGNVHAERWWPQQHVMRHASVMVCHGGFGSILTALAFGVPMAVVPMFADQFHNAARVAAAGAGIVLEGGPEAIGELTDHVTEVLAGDAYGSSARRVADEIAGHRPVTDSVEVLQDHAARL